MAARTLHELVAAAASLHADRTAVKYDAGSGSPASLLRYRDLVDLAGELAGVLRQNCSPGTGVVGLYCSDDLFTPRFQDAVGDHASVEVLSALPKIRLTLVRLAPRGPEHAGAPTAGRSREAGPGDLAYVLHTSGTTGLPKIVRVPHRCILPNILHLR
ncbi:Acyl-CoA synthetase family member 4 [Liparis tanakae]|uniref:Acyl-CoA synthetase family member 4 n=1 Tax=Liparis tanakae TaxID=230148 RepID=A0A4Z2FFT0_9TELE|nr:Acyl-CoA synthetase family member 4 [Liparis tanakae]